MVDEILHYVHIQKAGIHIFSVLKVQKTMKCGLLLLLPTLHLFPYVEAYCDWYWVLFFFFYVKGKKTHIIVCLMFRDITKDWLSHLQSFYDVSYLYNKGLSFSKKMKTSLEVLVTNLWKLFFPTHLFRSNTYKIVSLCLSAHIHTHIHISTCIHMHMYN